VKHPGIGGAKAGGGDCRLENRVGVAGGWCAWGGAKQHDESKWYGHAGEFGGSLLPYNHMSGERRCSCRERTLVLAARSSQGIATIPNPHSGTAQDS
jgi:hypothetical protein